MKTLPPRERGANALVALDTLTRAYADGPKARPLTSRHLAIIGIVGALPGIRYSKVAERLGLHSDYIASSTARLEDMGYLRITRPMDNASGVQYNLTQKGEDVLAKLLAILA